ncbi:hypothetical protein JL720_2727 [Aureococcus anophagefferens]|nr:hypothetical protein JL720_2727 [Aureococcus anophagefferens]
MGKLLLVGQTLFYAGMALPTYVVWIGLYTVQKPLLKLLTASSHAAMPPTIDAVQPGDCVSILVGLLELPLCVLSYFYYCCMQRALLPIGAKMRINLATDKWTDTLFLKLGQGKMEQKTIVGALLFGPRWNTHTNIVAYGNHMNRDTIGKCGKLATGGDTFEFPVETKAPYPTQFSLAIRSYLFDGTKEATLPKIWMDGELLNKEPSTFSKDKLAFNYDLRKAQRAHHLALHFYIWPLLCFRRFFTEHFVRWQYLPVGNPETQWLYGPTFAGYALNFKTLPTCDEDGAGRCACARTARRRPGRLEKIKVTLNRASKKAD